MTDAEVLAALDDRQTLALTMWAEARGVPRDGHSPIEGLVAVGCVVRNRRARFARWRASDASYKAICLAPKQFSCWNPGSGANHEALLTLARRLVLVGPIDATPELDRFRECLYLADGVIAGALIDRTGGANSYWAPAAMEPPGRVPLWATGVPTRPIGDQLFVQLA